MKMNGIHVILIAVALTLSCVAYYLIKYNFNQDIVIKLLTGAISGLIVFISFIILGFRSEVLRDGFTMFVPINKATNAIDIGDLPKADHRSSNCVILSELQRRSARQITISNSGEQGKTYRIFDEPTDDKSIDAINEDVIQYFLVAKIESIQRVSNENFTFYNTNEGLMVEPYQTVWPPDIERVSPDIIAAALSHNPIFRNNPNEQELWRSGLFYKLRLPKGSEILLKAEPSSELTGVEKRYIIIRKPNFFTIEFKIEAIGSNFQPLPTNFVFNNPNDINNHGYRITMEAHFDQLTSSNPKRSEYKAWIQWLMTRIKNSAVILLRPM